MSACYALRLLRRGGRRFPPRDWKRRKSANPEAAGTTPSHRAFPGTMARMRAPLIIKASTHRGTAAHRLTFRRPVIGFNDSGRKTWTWAGHGVPERRIARRGRMPFCSGRARTTDRYELLPGSVATVRSHHSTTRASRRSGWAAPQTGMTSPPSYGTSTTPGREAKKLAHSYIRSL